MNIINKHLLDDNGKLLHTWGRQLLVKGVLIHGISARNLDESKQYDMELIRQKIFMENPLSCHYLIGRDGTIWELIPPHRCAWHAGHSKYRGLNNLNNHFIGYELVGKDDEEYEDEQYKSLGFLANKHMTEYGFDSGMISLHSIVSGPGVRPDYKTDPWEYFDFVKAGHCISGGSI